MSRRARIRRFRRVQALDRSAHEQLERDLARCRRSDSSAALLVARQCGGAGFVPEIERFLRITDAVLSSGRHELVLLCGAPATGDGPAPLDRDALERRLGELTDGRLRCGWATFPGDGVSLEDLLRCAGRAADAVAEPIALDSRPSILALGR